MNATTHETLSQRSIYVIYGWLLALTVLEIVLVGFHFPPALAALLLGATTISKCMLILVYFMHLKFDGWLTWLLPIIPVALALFFTGMLFPDLVMQSRLVF